MIFLKDFPVIPNQAYYRKVNAKRYYKNYKNKMIKATCTRCGLVLLRKNMNKHNKSKKCKAYSSVAVITPSESI